MSIAIKITIDGHKNWSDAAAELRADGFKLGQDPAGFDLWRHQDGRAARIHWRSILGREIGRFVIEHGASIDGARQARISELVKRKGALIEQRVQTAGHGRRARIQEQIDAIAAELEELANASWLAALTDPESEGPELA